MALVLSLIGLACSLAAAVCGIIILISAFQDEVVQGILCLCVPFYVLYYALARFQHEKKDLILGCWIGLGILGAVLQFAAGAMAGGGGGGAGAF